MVTPARVEATDALRGSARIERKKPGAKGKARKAPHGTPGGGEAQGGGGWGWRGPRKLEIPARSHHTLTTRRANPLLISGSAETSCSECGRSMIGLKLTLPD